MRHWGVHRTESIQQAAVPRTAPYYTRKKKKKTMFSCKRQHSEIRKKIFM